ncbi:MAG: transposase [Geminicoccaceae bacterium]
MRKSRFSQEQQVAIVREADREDVAVVAKWHKITAQTIYIWKKRCGAFAAIEVRRLKALEIENARLTNLVTLRDLEIEAL